MRVLVICLILPLFASAFRAHAVDKWPDDNERICPHRSYSDEEFEKKLNPAGGHCPVDIPQMNCSPFDNFPKPPGDSKTVEIKNPHPGGCATEYASKQKQPLRYTVHQRRAGQSGLRYTRYDVPNSKGVILLFSGGPMPENSMLGAPKDIFPPDYDVIMFDQAGVGRNSEVPDDMKSPEGTARLGWDIIRQEHLGDRTPYVILGQSWGTKPATIAASLVDRTHRPRSVLLDGTRYKAVEETKRDQANRNDGTKCPFEDRIKRSENFTQPMCTHLYA